MPKKPVSKESGGSVDDVDDLDTDAFDDDEPIPARRDTRIFHREKEDKDKDEDFEEDVFV